MASQIFLSRRRHLVLRKIKSKPPVARLSPQGYLRRCARLTALGLTVLASGVYVPAARASGPAFGSPAWYAQKFPGGKPAVSTATPTAGIGGVTTPTQAATRANKSIDHLRLAAQRIADQQAAQLSAAQNAAIDTSVPNGLGAGGLDPNVDSSNGGVWINAAAPTTADQATDAAGKTTVTVNQTSDRAVMTWNTFNIGQQTTLHIDQTAGNQTTGGNNWIAVNRITGGSPSTILGGLKAEGTVYVLNPNGILFGAGSQVNTHSFMATSLSFIDTDVTKSNSDFIDKRDGLLTPANLTSTSTGSFPALVSDTATSVDSAGDIQLPGKVEVDAGATIQTGAQGFSLLAAPTVNNYGTIRADDGQAMLVGGFNVLFDSVSTGSANSLTWLTPHAYGTITDSSLNDVTPSLTVTNTGIISAARGNVTLTGSDVVQDGVVAVSTSLSHPGSINISASDEYGADIYDPYAAQRKGLVRIGASASLINLPDEDGETTSSSQSATTAFQPGSMTLSGGAVTLEKDALVEMPGGTLSISVDASQRYKTQAVTENAVLGRIYMDTGATIDVSGLADVQLSLDSALVAIPRIGQNELADSPTQRDSILYRNKDIVIDSTLSGTRSDGTTWVGSPLLNASGYVDGVTRSVSQLLINGGTVNLSGAQVITNGGSSINIDGGYEHYMAGYVGGASRLLDSRGRIISIGKADPLNTYVGLAGYYTQTASKGTSSRTYINPLLSGKIKHYDPGYIVGGDAGSLNISWANLPVGGHAVALLDGDLSAQAYAGRYQVSGGSLPNGGRFGLSFADAVSPNRDTAVTFTASVPTLDSIVPNFAANTILETPTELAKASSDPSNILYWTPLSSLALSNAGFSNIAVNNVAQVLVRDDGALTVQPGGSINFSAQKVTVLADLTAAGGQIDLSTPTYSDVGGVTFASGDGSSALPTNDILIGDASHAVTISTRGRWVNDTGLGVDEQAGTGYLNGGSISLTAFGSTTSDGQTDTSGRILLSTGSTLDVSGGGRINAAGKFEASDGIPVGRGGDISLSTYTGHAYGAKSEDGENPPYYVTALTPASTALPCVDTTDCVGAINLDGAHLLGYGFSGGGTLSLHALDIQIGGDRASAASKEELYLSPDFFTLGGFGAYKLSALWDATIASSVTVQEANLIPDYGRIYSAPTGAQLYDPTNNSGGYASIGQLDSYHRQAASFSLSSGEYLSTHSLEVAPSTPRPNLSATGGEAPVTGTTFLDSTALLQVDPGATVKLSSLNQVTVLGDITAHGGQIILSGDSVTAGDSAIQDLSSNGLSGYAPPDNVDLYAYSSSTKSVFLGSDSVLDVSGAKLTNPLAAPVRSENGQMVVPQVGKVLDGGKVILSNDTGLVIASVGSVINISGCTSDACFDPNNPTGAGSNTLDLLTAGGSSSPISAPHYETTAVPSNAGSVVLGAAGGMYFDATLTAKHESTAAGGSLTITAEDSSNAANLVGFAAQRIDLIGTRVNTTVATPAADGILYFSLAGLQNSGIDNLTVGQAPELIHQGALASDHAYPLTIAFVGDVNATVVPTLAGSLKLTATNYAVLSSDQVTEAAGLVASQTPPQVELSAAYISLTGFANNGDLGATASSGAAIPIRSIDTSGTTGTLTLDAKLGMDVGGTFALQNFSETTLRTEGDLRFVTPNSQVLATSSGVVGGTTGILNAGELLDGFGNLTLQANQIYPASGNAYVVYSQGDVHIKGNDAAPQVPLSAGGALWIDAATIDLSQGAILRAPDGDITLGFAGNEGTTQAQCATGICYFDGYGLYVPLKDYHSSGDSSDASIPDFHVVHTTGINLDASSLVSVSTDGTLIPYGFTSNGKDWKYIPLDDGSLEKVLSSSALLDNLNGLSNKRISLSGDAVTLAGTVNLSSAADASNDDLQAQEWVPGTGGTRDVLSRTQTVYTTGTATTVGTFSDNRPIYAIIPGRESTLGAYDPALDADGSGPMVGQSVYLSGVAGLAAGYYTLLPARYATLPGAYRVVQNTSSSNVLASRNMVQSDGSYQVAGYFAQATTATGGFSYSGAGVNDGQTALSTSFTVQSRDVWEKYSEYTLSSANDYFSSQASTDGTVTPLIPRDAGQLVLQAQTALDLSGKLLQQVAKDGRNAEVDLSAPAIQIGIAGSGSVQDGYLFVDTAQLSDFGAASLLIGGTRSSSGAVITPVASNVIVDNAGTALTAGEVLLAAQTVTLKDGAEIQASGATPAHDSALSFSGDTAFLAVSNADSVELSPLAAGASQLSIGNDVVLGGTALTLAATGGLSIGGSAQFNFSKAVELDVPALTLLGGNTTSVASGIVLDPATLNQFSQAQHLTINSATDINFDGDMTLVFGQTGQADSSLSLHGQRLLSDGGSVNIQSDDGTLILSSSTDPASTSSPTATTGLGNLNVQVGQIELAGGAMALGGFNTIALSAHGSEHAGIAGTEGAYTTGHYDFGAANVQLDTPLLTVGTGITTTLLTTGGLSIDNSVGASDLQLVNAGAGGVLNLSSGVMNVGSHSLNPVQISALSGILNLGTSSGDLNLGSESQLSVAGVAKTFFDVSEYAPGGALELNSSVGSINIASNAILDFSSAIDSNGVHQGNAGSASLIAASEGQGVAIDTTVQLLGAGGSGLKGGSFSLDSGKAITLDPLALQLATGGVTNSISLHSREGAMQLSAGNALQAHSIELIADGQDSDGSSLIIAGTLDASSKDGDAYAGKAGTIGLYGNRDVLLTGSLLATGAAQGGDVTLSTAGTASLDQSGNALTDATYGYERVSSTNAGTIGLSNSAVIDVSAGSDGKGGTIALRAPLLDDGSVNLSLNAPSEQIKGARSLSLEAYAVWNTTDKNSAASCNDTGSCLHFDGYIDPAGWYDNSGVALVTPEYQIVGYASDYSEVANVFYSTTAANASHVSFYGTTLEGFVQHGLGNLESQLQQQYPTLTVSPGIELRNSDESINHGDITVLTNWNLAALKGLDAGGNIPTLADGTTDWSQFLYRTSSGQAPVLTLRAKHDVDMQASITDGFVQRSNAISYQAPDPSTYELVQASYQALCASEPALCPYLKPPADPDKFAGGDAAQIAQYYGLYKQYIDYLRYDLLPVGMRGSIGFEKSGTPADLLSDVTLVNGDGSLAQTGALTYAKYLSNYDRYFAAHVNNLGTDSKIPVFMLQAPTEELVPLFTGAALAEVAYGNSPQATSENPLPLLSATLAGGNSTSYHLVAGADFSSAKMDSVLSATSAGSVILEPSKLNGADRFYDTAVWSFYNENGYQSGSLQPILTPTLLRTGTGSIDINAAGDVQLKDTLSDGTMGATPAIYAAGAPAAGTVASTRSGLMQSYLYGASYDELVVTGVVHAVDGGNIRIAAGNDVTHLSSSGATPLNNAASSQAWWQWMQTGNDVTLASADTVAAVNASSINFGGFAQGILSMGGDVSLNAGHTINDISVSLPSTWSLQTDSQGAISGYQTYGGRNQLLVSAGSQVIGGSYFVSQGSGEIKSGGTIGGDDSHPFVLAEQDAQLTLTSRGSITLDRITNPSYSTGVFDKAGPYAADLRSYSADSSTSAISVAGDLHFNSNPQSTIILPASLSLVSFNGELSVENPGSLFPSATGQLDLIAAQSVRFFAGYAVGPYSTSASPNKNYFGLIDVDPAIMPSPENQTSITGNYLYSDAAGNPQQLHDPHALHADDNQIAHIYSLEGDVTDGHIAGNYATATGMVIQIDKAASIQAGRDIVDLIFDGQQLHDSDVTRIVAGRDILNSTAELTQGNSGVGAQGALAALVPRLTLGGVGTFDIEAGRNIGPLTGQIDVLRARQVAIQQQGGGDTGTAPLTGIDTVGNANNPFLPQKSASINLWYGVGPGIDLKDFIASYIDPSQTSRPVGIPSYDSSLIDFVERYEQGKAVDTGLVIDVPAKPTLSLDSAWAEFQTLPSDIQRLFVAQVFNSVLKQTASDYNDANSPYYQQYARGYTAINTLFPASYGYTANDLSGGANGANQTVHTGDLDLQGTTIQTQQGGNIAMFGPGGQAVLGSTSAPPLLLDSNGNLFAGPSTQGVLTLKEGEIDGFLDRSLRLAQSRIFTEQGGDVLLWSSNGDINAGKGAKTTTELAAPNYVCDLDNYCTIDSSGQVSGAGIATLQTTPDAPAGNAYLVAPRGTVDAGDAGIRVAGNLVIAAQAVANADNVQVSGKSNISFSGQQPTVNVQTDRSGVDAFKNTIDTLTKTERQTDIDVEIVGVGTPDEEQKKKIKKKQ